MVVLHTRFTDPAAVEAWDAHFRWREGDVLHDVTVDDTWWRVAGAIAAADGGRTSAWAQRYAQAFSRWRMLPDEALLRVAGTGGAPAAGQAPCAVLNIAEFITVPLGAAPGLDRAALVETAALAVRMLDDALRSGASLLPPGQAPRVGLMGVSDALRKLHVPYASAGARWQAAEFAHALAEGCLRGSVELAGERGPLVRGGDCAHLAELWRARAMPAELIARALTDGVRYAMLTAVDPHPLLARLANGVADGLAPTAFDAQACPGDEAGMLLAEAELGRSVQPWIGAPGDGDSAVGSRDNAPSTQAMPAHAGLPRH